MPVTSAQIPFTDTARRLLHEADIQGYRVTVSTHGDIMAGRAEHVVVRLHPDTDTAKRRMRLAGREDRVIECAAVLHPDEELAPFALEAALNEAVELHRHHLALVVT